MYLTYHLITVPIFTLIIYHSLDLSLHTLQAKTHLYVRFTNPFLRCLSGATFSKLLRKILGKDSYLIDDLGKTAILKTS